MTPKSRLLTAVFLAGGLLHSTPALAATMGFVDTQKIFTQYKDAQSSQSEFRKKAEAYQRELIERNAELQKAQKDGKSKAEMEKMTKNFETELKPKKQAVEALDKELSAKLKKRIEAAIAQVASAKNIPVVVDKQVILFGGQDLTEDVLQKLNTR